MTRDEMTMCDLAEVKDIDEMKVHAKREKWICSELGVLQERGNISVNLLSFSFKMKWRCWE